MNTVIKLMINVPVRDGDDVKAILIKELLNEGVEFISINEEGST